MPGSESTSEKGVTHDDLSTAVPSRHILKRVFSVTIAGVLAAIAVIAINLFFLSKGLHDPTDKTLDFSADSFVFAFGSGQVDKGHMHVDGFVNGYALLSSGPVRIQAETTRALRYHWIPPRPTSEAAFFWRRSDDTQNVIRTDITSPGTNHLDLSYEPGWHGEITEFGFLLAGVDGDVVEIGEASLMPDNIDTRLQLAWRAWTAFEPWSQQSIIFIHGGDRRQIVSLPLLVTVWLISTLLFSLLILKLGKKVDSSQLLIIAFTLFLVGWILLDIRWAANNIRQIGFSLASGWQMNEQQRLNSDLDGDIFQYVQRLKSTVLGGTPARILIVGDENAIDYYLLRTKYHLLPHSAFVTSRFTKNLKPGSVDFVVYFGQPSGIVETPGWNMAWRQSLVQVDSGKWGTVYRTR